MSRSLTILAAVLLLAAASTRSEAAGPEPLRLAAPIETWDEGVPLGNGLTGGLLWGAGNTIHLSLDRGDLWDERRPEEVRKPDWTWDTIRKLKAAGNQKEISRRFDRPYSQIPHPTKLPGGRLVLTLEADRTAESFELDLSRALGRVRLTNGALTCFFSAVRPVAMVRVPGSVTTEIRRPAGLDKLGYDPAKTGRADGVTWMVQTAAEGLVYAIVVAARSDGEDTLLAVAITSNRDGDDPLAIGKRRVGEALEAGFDTLLAPHEKWWSDFWSISNVSIPAPRLQRHYDFVKYLYGAGSRAGAPPMPLQGVWTRDDGGLPPWKGDFHHDLNTQMTYLAAHAAGLVDAERSFLDRQWELLPVYRAFARDFYGVEGAAVPGVATLAGRATGGWSQYSLSPT
ncbi:MAG: glycoside hydrolase N-terminal domain-containing protein, partial [Planctomycetota bacterium]